MYADIIEGLVEVVERVDGITQVLDYAPNAIHKAPCVCITLDSFTRAGGVMTYRIQLRLYVNWQDNERAEQQIKPLINGIPTALDQNAQLGQRLTRGQSTIVDARAQYRVLGGIVYRVVDFYAQVIDKSEFGTFTP